MSFAKAGIESTTDSLFWLVGITSFLLSFVICVMLYRAFEYRNSNDISLTAVQAAHNSPTSRLGGLGILGATALLTLFLEIHSIINIFLGSLLIIFFGLLEDFHIRTHPKLRLLGGMLSAYLGIYLTNTSLTSIDIDWMSGFFSMGVISVAFTIFAIVVLTNAFNIIDGTNGFAAGNIIITCTALFVISAQVDEAILAILTVAVTAATLGFFVLNFPKGKIFLGDTGAYLAGFIIAWILILLAENNESIGKWSLLCIVFWPIMDTVYSIFRRRIKNKSADKPDKLHFHQLVMRGWELLSYGKIKRTVSNPLATATILPFAAIPVIFGVLFIDDKIKGLILFLTFSGSYVIMYNALYICLSRKKYRSTVSEKLKPIFAFFLD